MESIPQTQMPVSDTVPVKAPMPPQSERPAKVKRSPHGDIKKARRWLVLIFLTFRALDALILLTLPPGDNSKFIAGVLVGGIWTTALLVGIWTRQIWARFILITLLTMGVVGSMILVPAVFRTVEVNHSALAILGIVAFVLTAIAIVLGRSVDIHRLTDKHRQ